MFSSLCHAAPCDFFLLEIEALQQTNLRLQAELRALQLRYDKLLHQKDLVAKTYRRDMEKWKKFKRFVTEYKEGRKENEKVKLAVLHSLDGDNLKGGPTEFPKPTSKQQSTPPRPNRGTFKSPLPPSSPPTVSSTNSSLRSGFNVLGSKFVISVRGLD